MKAWPAAKELRTKGAVEGPLGLAALVVALLNDPPWPWLYPLLAIALLALSWALRGRDQRHLAGLVPLSGGVVVSRHGRWYLELPGVAFSAALAVFLLPSRRSRWPDRRRMVLRRDPLADPGAGHRPPRARAGVRMVHVRENALGADRLRVVAV